MTLDKLELNIDELQAQIPVLRDRLKLATNELALDPDCENLKSFYLECESMLLATISKIKSLQEDYEFYKHLGI
jgi:hypothetical protein